jgi:hypothetical protein
LTSLWMRTWAVGLVLIVTAWCSRWRSLMVMVTPLSGRTGPRNGPC